MIRRLVIITEIISPYRIPVFNGLARHEEINLHVIFLAETDPTQRDWLVYKDEINFSYEVLPSWRRRLGKYHCLLNWGVRSALRRAAPDVILCGGYSYLASWTALVWAQRNRIPFLSWIESTQKDQRSRRTLVESLKKRFMSSCDGFVVPGKSSFEYVKSYGAGEAQIYCAPNAVDNKVFAARAERVRSEAPLWRQRLHLPEHYFLFVGRMVFPKGIFELLQAYIALPPILRASWGLVFVGDGPARRELENLAASVCPGKILVPGFKQRDELAAYYGLADVFVLPTHTDTWGLVVNEAMACGLPVITTNAAGCTADLVQDNRNGRIVSVSDVAELASAMGQLASDEPMRLQMGRNSSQLIQGYSPDACAQGIAGAAVSTRKSA